MTITEIKQIIQQELPQALAQDPAIRDFILRTVSEYYAGKPETDTKFDRILADFERDREVQRKKWDEQNASNQRVLDEIRQLREKQDATYDRLERDREEQNRKWEEQNRKWEEQNRKWDEQHACNKQILDEIRQLREKQDATHDRLERDREEQIRRWNEQHATNQQLFAEIQKTNRRHDSAIGALGARWGLNSEASFRNALKGILADSFGVEVLNINDFDADGEVFGRPDQVEIDVVIKNGIVIVCEIKSSMDKGAMYLFNRKVDYYEKHYQRLVNRKLVISPMVSPNAFPVAKRLGIEVYSYAEDVPETEPSDRL